MNDSPVAERIETKRSPYMKPAPRRRKSEEELNFQELQGRLLKEARDNAGFSLPTLKLELIRQFPNIVGLNITTIAYAERGERALHPHRLYILAKIYGVSLSSLFGPEAHEREILSLEEATHTTEKGLLEIPPGAALKTVQFDNFREGFVPTGYYLLANHDKSEKLYHIKQKGDIPDHYTVTLPDGKTQDVSAGYLSDFLKNTRQVRKVVSFCATL